MRPQRAADSGEFALASSPKRGMLFVRFAAAGLANTLAGLSVYAAILFIWNSVGLAVLGSVIFGAAFNFFTYLIAFRRRPSLVFLWKFLTFFGLFFFFNFFLVRLGQSLGSTPFVSQVVAAPVLASVSFLGLRFFVYRERN